MCPHALPETPVREASFSGMIRYCETGLEGDLVHAQFMARQLVRMAGAEQLSKRLLELEGQIPAEQGSSSASFELWHAWRRAVQRSESAAELLPQVGPPLSAVLTALVWQGSTCKAFTLVTLDGRIPAEQGSSSASFELWHAWRRAVRRSESAAELLPQVGPPLSAVLTALVWQGSTCKASLL